MEKRRREKEQEQHTTQLVLKTYLTGKMTSRNIHIQDSAILGARPVPRSFPPLENDASFTLISSWDALSRSRRLSQLALRFVIRVTLVNGPMNRPISIMS